MQIDLTPQALDVIRRRGGAVTIDFKRFLIWDSFDVRVVLVHAHAPGIT